MRACIEFLDEQGVQPCGHKAREKGILLKVYASCLPSQIPTQYRYTVNAIDDDLNYYTSKHLSDTQHTYGYNFTRIHCEKSTLSSKLCTVQPGYTWEEWRTTQRVHCVRGKDKGQAAWHYVLIEDDDEVLQSFLAKLNAGRLNVADFGRVLKSGWGKNPPKNIKEMIEDRYVNYMYKLSKVRHELNYHCQDIQYQKL